MDNGKRYFGTLEGIQALIDHDRRVAQLCRLNDQNGKHYKYANIWRNALNHIFTQSRTTKKHFDTICLDAVKDNSLWKETNELTLANINDVSDDGSRAGGNPVYTPRRWPRQGSDNPNNFACIDTMMGKACRQMNDFGYCSYSHRPGARPSPNYHPATDPRNQYGSPYPDYSGYSPSYSFPPGYPASYLGGGAAAAPVAAAAGNEPAGAPAAAAAMVPAPVPMMPMAPFSMGAPPYPGFGFGKGGYGKGAYGKGKGGAPRSRGRGRGRW